MTFFPVSVRKFTLDIFIYQKVTLVTLGRGISKSDIRGGGEGAESQKVTSFVDGPQDPTVNIFFFLRK